MKESPQIFCGNNSAHNSTAVRMSRVGCRGIESNARFTLQPVLEMPGLKARSGGGCDLVATQKTRSAYLVETSCGVNVD